MIITYYGTSFLKLQVGDFTVAVNPTSKASGAKTARFGADVALVSLHHPDYNGTDQLSYGEKQPFVIDGPGEYEVRNLVVKGFLTRRRYGGQRPADLSAGALAKTGASREDGKDDKVNTLYYLSLDDLSLCIFGALDKAAIDEHIREEIGAVDILFAPIGGKEVLSAADAHKLALSFSPGVIIPTHYESTASAAYKKFLEEAGSENTKPVDKLTVKKKDLAERQADVVVLKASV